MSKFQFKPEDFHPGCFEDGCTREHELITSDKEMADTANAILEAHLKTLPRVTATGYITWNTYRSPTDAYTALLWDITEIGKE